MAKLHWTCMAAPCLGAIAVLSAVAQSPKSLVAGKPGPPASHAAAQAVRVYVSSVRSEEPSWGMRGRHTGSRDQNVDFGGGSIPDGIRSPSADVIKTFNEKCPQVTVTDDVVKADFTVILDHEEGKGVARRKNKVVVFDHNGDDIYSGSTRGLGNAVKDACSAIVTHVQLKQSARGQLNRTSLGARPFSIAPAFEPVGPRSRTADGGTQFVARAANMEVAFTRRGIELAARASGSAKTRACVASLRFLQHGTQMRSAGDLQWRGVHRLRGETNYLLGNDPAKWRTHVPHYARVEAAEGSTEIAAYRSGDAVEYDLRVPPTVNASQIRLAVSGAGRIRLDQSGNLVMRVGPAEFRMDKPVVYEEATLETTAFRAHGLAAEMETVSNYKSRVGSPSARTSIRSSRRGRSHRSSRGRNSRNTSGRRSHRSTRSRSRRSNGHRRTRGATRARRTTRRRTRTATGREQFPAAPSPAVPTELATTSPHAIPVGKQPLDGRYVLEPDGTIGFHVARRDPRATLVIDPTISLAYSSFLGGEGSDIADSVTTDSSGNVYIAGTTTSPATFPETTTAQLGPGLPANTGTGDTAKEFFIAKIDPTQTGANSLVYLTFLGGSTGQTGGLIAVDTAGDVAITGTTSSADFPVTDSSTRTAGANDTVVSEIDPTGSKLLYSTMFGGSGAESQENAGGIALDSGGDIYVASDTNSTDLPVTTGAYATAYVSTGNNNDGFLAEFQPGATPALRYCTYFGLDDENGVGGIAIDTLGNVYVSGFTSDANSDFPAKNAAQTTFGGGAFDAFLMKITPAGRGAQDLVYATLLGGNNSDKAFAVALDSANPPNAYITGTTASTNFPTNGAVAAHQTTLPSNATSATSDAFVSVIAQNATTGMTSLAYSTYLGGSQTDTGYSIEAAQPYAVYVGGTANSWDFPWRDNFQPFNGYGNAFLVKLDTTTAGTLGLVYSTPIGGTSPAGVQAGTQGNAVTVDASGNVWIAGQTTSLDFASAGNPANGFQQLCGSCQESPIAPDAFIVEVQENATQELPSLYFAGQGIPLNFGTQAIGATNVPLQFAAIKNGGEATLNITNIGIIGPNSSDFALSNWTSCESAAIAPGGLCSFEVGFVPSVAAQEEAFVQITSNAPGSPQVLELVGTGAGLDALPGSLEFAQQIVGTVSMPQSVTLTNTSSVQLFIDSVAEGGADPVMFVPATNAQQCVASAAGMLSGKSCLVDMTFDPTTVGTLTAQIEIGYHLSGEPEQQQTIGLSGVSVAAAPIATVLPVSLNFGTLTIGQASAAQIVTLTNTGNVTLGLTSINLTGANASDFVLVNAGSAPCPTGSGSVATSASCTVGVQFAPQTAGAKSATLSFADDASGSPQTMALTGTAPSPSAIQVTPNALTFASQAVGTKSTAKLVTIANAGGTALAVNGISLTGTNAADFSETNNCPPSLAADASCVADVVFSPAAPGTRSASLTITDDVTGSPQQIALSGTATQAGVTLSTASVNFGNQAVGTASAAISVTVTNSGNGPLVISGLSFAGVNMSDFSETDTCTGSAAGTGIAAGGTCAIQIVFKPECGPVVSAARVATLSLVDNAPGNPQTLAVSGTGTGPFCFIVPSGGTTSESVSPGQTGNFALQVEAANAFTGNVNLACAGAPANGACAVAPTTVNIGGSEAPALQVSVTTSAGDAAKLTPGSGRSNKDMPGALFLFTWLVLAILATLIVLINRLVPRSDREYCCERRLAFVQRSGWSWLAVAFCVALVMGGALVACGGGGSATGNSIADPATPAGTYTVTVSGTTSGGTSQTIALTLTVQ